MSETYVSAPLRRLVRERAQSCCEYCLIPESQSFYSQEIDHVVAEKHGGKTDEHNLAWSCMLCNKHKGSDLTSIDPVSGEIVPLFHPRRDRWTDHFQLAAIIEPLTPSGRVTVRLLQLNRPDRVAERESLISSGLIRVPNIND